jgi:HJR/Mrr/RecB family endonuclease
MEWIFQANPKRYDILAAISGGVDRDWSMNQGRKYVSPGDRVFFWESGSRARLVAVGRVTSPVYERESEFGAHGVQVSYDFLVEPPLTREEIRAMGHPLDEFKPFSGFMGTNARISDVDVVVALDTALAPRLKPLEKAPFAPDLQRSQIDLDHVIKNARRETAQLLQKSIAEMDPVAFEWLISVVLAELGYRDIEVTKPSNDGGVDLRARLVAGGIANIETAVQVKRTQSVGRPVVQNLRGSLSARESGLLVTSGTFTEGAKEEAKVATKAPIALIDGARLVDILLEKNIGASEKVYKVYSLEPEALLLERLKARPHPDAS